MKQLFLIGGTMGVGKTTACKILKERLPNCVFLDGDWCWDMSPFQVTPQTKRMVMENICFLLGQFIRCPAYENVVFCWVMHERRIIEEILERIDTRQVRLCCISLVCSPKELERRLRRDVEKGLRQEDVIERSLARLPLYEQLPTKKIDVTHMTSEQTAERIRKAFGGGREVE